MWTVHSFLIWKYNLITVKFPLFSIESYEFWFFFFHFFFFFLVLFNFLTFVAVATLKQDYHSVT